MKTAAGHDLQAVTRRQLVKPGTGESDERGWQKKRDGNPTRKHWHVMTTNSVNFLLSQTLAIYLQCCSDGMTSLVNNLANGQCHKDQG